MASTERSPGGELVHYLVFTEGTYGGDTDTYASSLCGKRPWEFAPEGETATSDSDEVNCPACAAPAPQEPPT